MKFLIGLLLIAFANAALWKQMTNVDFNNQYFLKAAWDEWKTDFKMSYESITEDSKRFLIFIDTWKSIVDHNEHPTGNWTERINQFSDLTPAEFKAWVGRGLKQPQGWVAPKPVDLSHVEVPKSVDWTKKGVVTPVKNQGSCGSCWTFSTTGSVECRYAIKTGHLNSLSEQQIVDCDRENGNDGCNGGWPYHAMQYVHQQGGLCTESEYPYTAVDGTCQQSSCGTKYDDISSEAYVTPGSTLALEQAIVTGCTSVLVDASWQNYNSGVYSAACGTSLDHAVLAVGYGSMNGNDYWKIKNSWGASWGDNGYIYLCRNCGHQSTGECGVLKQPSYPIV
jgi:C1A family cysteine protease